MKIKITKAALSEVLNTVQTVVDGKSAVSILQNVKIEAADGKAVFTCTNLDVTMIATAACEVVEAGQTTLPAKILSAIIGKAVDGIVDVSVDDKAKAKISAGTSRYNINGTDAASFPQLPELTGESATLPVEVLREMLRKTSFAVSQDDTRRTFTGVLLDFATDGITAVGTDGCRMSRYKVKASIPESFAKQYILPRKAVDVLKARLPKEGEVELTAVGAQLKFKFGENAFITKLIDNTYPNYNLVIPKSLAFEVEVDRDALVGAIDRISVLSGIGEDQSVRIKFDANLVSLKAFADVVGDCTDEVPAKYDGDEIEMRLNPVYIKDVLNALDEDVIKVKLNNGFSPAVITTTDDVDITYVIMPLRFNS